MKKVLPLFSVLFLGAVFLCSPASAVPTLQLDISKGVYDNSTETIVTQADKFTLYALLKDSSLADPDNKFYISIALSPMVSADKDLGFFVFDRSTYYVTDDMKYGTPPISTVTENDPELDLNTHEIFPTYFTEVEFNFNLDDFVREYDSQLNPGGFGSSTSNKLLYYAMFDVDVTGLATDYQLHFDLYNTKIGNKGVVQIDQFAPFSHDAQTVPEAATMLLLGAGLIGLAGFGRKKLFKKA